MPILDRSRLADRLREEEQLFRRTALRNGGESVAAIGHELDRYIHLFTLNRGILMTPFHNMPLISPETTLLGYGNLKP